MSKRCVIISGGELDEELTLSVHKQQKDRCVIGVKWRKSKDAKAAAQTGMNAQAEGVGGKTAV